MMMEPLAVKPMSVKFAVGEPVSMKFAAVKPAMGKSSKSPVKSTRRSAMEPASPAVEPAATMGSTAAMRSCAGDTGLDERCRQQQCS
jgi:hypothetical protein